MTTLQETNHRKFGRRRPLILRPVIAVLAVTAALFSGSATAQDADEPAAAPEQVVIFVIDLSGSMNQPFDDTRTKLDVAKTVFTNTFTNTAQDALVGLRVFGDQFPAQPPDARTQNCTEDTRLISPAAVIDRGPLIDQVLSLEARGDTAIALALQAANNDIPEGALGTVYLFSDGRDECFDADLDGDPASGPSYGEDPCEVAKSIAGDGVDLRIDRVNTIGLRTDAAAEFELQCIANATGGSFTKIDTDEDIAETSNELAERASESARVAERLGGLPIVGTPSQDAAPDFGRLDDGSTTGRYTDSIAMNSEKWYRFAEYGPGGGTFTATAFGLPGQEGIEFGMRLYLPESDQTFFGNRSDSNAGLPERPTKSIRCPGCSVSGGPNEVYWVVSLTTENQALGGTYDLEILTEGPGFGGVSTSCNEGQECWYEAQIAQRQAALESIQEEIDAARAAQTTEEPPPAAGSGTNLSGDWETEYGPMTFGVNGTTFVGTYPDDAGGLDGAIAGSTVSGTWTSNQSAEPCDEERLGTTGWGLFVFEFDAAGQNFSGLWNYCDLNPELGWDGNRPAGFVPPTVEVAPELVEERDRLSDEIATLRDELATAESTAESDEAEAELARLKAGDLRLQADNSDDGATSLTLPLLLALIGLAAGGAALFLRRQREQVPLAADVASSSEGVVIGAVTGHPEPAPVPAPDPPPPAQESPPEGEAAPPEVIDDGVVAGGSGFDAGEDALEVPLPGWYDDPDDPTQLRWWDGNDWTDNTQAQDAGDES